MRLTIVLCVLVQLGDLQRDFHEGAREVTMPCDGGKNGGGDGAKPKKKICCACPETKVRRKVPLSPHRSSSPN